MLSDGDDLETAKEHEDGPVRDIQVDQEMQKLPLSEDLLKYYRSRIEKAEDDMADALQRIDKCRLDHQAHHQLEWTLQQRNKELSDLQKALSDSQAYLYDERKQLLRVMAENDRLKIQELRDRKKIRYLLSLCKIEEDETTYFKRALDKRFVRGELAADKSLTVREKEAWAAAQSVNEKEMDSLALNQIDEKEETDIDVLRALISALKAQLDEQIKLNDEQARGYADDKRIREEEERLRAARDNQRLEMLLRKTQQLEHLVRESTKDLLERRRHFQVQERRIREERTALMDTLKTTQKEFIAAKAKNDTIAKQVEQKVRKKQEVIVQDLKIKSERSQQQVKQLQSQLDTQQITIRQQVDTLKHENKRLNENFKSLQKRRQTEIEGFTSDINILRKQVQILEQSLMQLGPLEDRELILLNLAKDTGRKASRISNELRSLKARMYKMEEDVHQLPF